MSEEVNEGDGVKEGMRRGTSSAKEWQDSTIVCRLLL